MAKVSKWYKGLKNKCDAILDKAGVRQWLLAFIVFGALFAILGINLLPSGVDLDVGQVSARDILAPRTVINRPATERLQADAARQAVREASENPEFLDINHATVIRAEERLEESFALFADTRGDEEPTQDTNQGEQEDVQEPEPGTPTVSEEELSDLRLSLQRDWQIELSDDVLQAIVTTRPDIYERFEIKSKEIILGLMQERIPEEDVEEVESRVTQLAANTGLPAPLQRGIIQLGADVIQPNLVLNTQKVEQARQDAIKSVEPVTILKGEVILRKGDVVREDHIAILQDLGLHRSTVDYLALFGLMLTVFLLLALLGMYLFQYRKDILENDGQLALLGSVLVVVSFVIKVLALIQWPEAGFLAPVALASMLLTILLDSRVAVIAALVLAIIAAVVNGFDITFLLIALAGGLTGVFSVSKVSQRGDLMRAGFVVGGVNFLMMVALGLLQRETGLIVHSYLGILNGLLASIIAIGSLAYLESIFGITSAIRLLELSNPNHPLLRRLLMETPGTYHHSIIVGNLAEAAADATGADGLLARVGSHFHDIGKLKRPYFFVENQVGMDNPHDKMAPSLSTLIIISHVKDGIELAKEYKLPDVIISFIAEHHGSDLVKYFYHRAKESGNDNVEDSDFRYSGPKPQSKETAIVSLADATEAAVRSLSKPTPGKIESLVYKIIRDRLNDGQLDESDLTFKDLDKIADAFVKVLIGIFHVRVEYPETITREEIEGKKPKGGNSNKQ